VGACKLFTKTGDAFYIYIYAMCLCPDILAVCLYA
jgi:hypothetical protein